MNGGADRAAPPPADGSAPPLPPPLVDEFDADGNGALDSVELATLQATMRVRIRAGEPLHGM